MEQAKSNCCKIAWYILFPTNKYRYIGSDCLTNLMPWDRYSIALVISDTGSSTSPKLVLANVWKAASCKIWGSLG